MDPNQRHETLSQTCTGRGSGIKAWSHIAERAASSPPQAGHSPRERIRGSCGGLLWAGRTLEELDLVVFLDALVNLSKRLLRSQQSVPVEKRLTLFAHPVELVGKVARTLFARKRVGFDDIRLDQSFEVLIERSLTFRGVEIGELLHRGTLTGMAEDVLKQYEPRVLRDDVQALAFCILVVNSVRRGRFAHG